MSMFVNNIADTIKPLPVSAANTDWSVSRMQIFETCQRKYYYQYFGGKMSAAQNEQDKDTINFLKQFSNAHLIAGDIVHFVIRTYFKNLRRGNRWELERLKGFAGRMIKDACNYSKELRDGVFREYEHVPRSLLEVFYKEKDAFVLGQLIKVNTDKLLDNFYISEAFALLRAGGEVADALVERKIGFNLPGVHIDGVADLIYPDGENWVIADWKTGTSEAEDTSLQLLVYGLWLIREKGISEDKILIYKAYLNECVLEPLEFSKIQIQRARGRILQDVERLKEVEDFGKEGNIQAFMPCGQEKVCAQCSFKKLCIVN